MSSKAISEKLRELSKKTLKRSMAARLRDLSDEISEALKNGVGREEIVKVLAEDGLIVTLKNFDMALHRHRKKLGKARNKVQGNNNESLDSLQQSSEPSSSKPTSDSHNPASLDAIIKDTPDLTALAKQFKQSQLKGKQK